VAGHELVLRLVAKLALHAEQVHAGEAMRWPFRAEQRSRSPRGSTRPRLHRDAVGEEGADVDVDGAVGELMRTEGRWRTC
jgi:hypothetical protein